jgi:hypothetical protein
VVCADNTLSASMAYPAYFRLVNAPSNAFRTMTLPFHGGLEMTVKIA